MCRQRRTEPPFIEPMQCKPVTALPAGEKWTFEIKFDGYRCIAVKRARDVTLFSRHQKVLNRRFPGVVEALASLEGDFVLDGELVALDSQGRPSFQILQNSLSHELPTYFYAFDLLNRNGELLVKLPLSRRRELLEDLLAAPKDPVATVATIAGAIRSNSRGGAQARPGRRRGQTDRFPLRTWRAIRRMDQAPHEPGAGVRHRWLRSRRTRIRCVARGCLREEGAHVRREGEERLRAANPGRALPGAQGAANCPVPVQESAREEGITVGRVVNRREDGRNAAGSNRSWSARSPSSNGPMPGICGIAPSSPCAMTRSRRRWFAKLEGRWIHWMETEEGGPGRSSRLATQDAGTSREDISFRVCASEQSLYEPARDSRQKSNGIDCRVAFPVVEGQHARNAWIWLARRKSR